WSASVPTCAPSSPTVRRSASSRPRRVAPDAVPLHRAGGGDRGGKDRGGGALGRAPGGQHRARGMVAEPVPQGLLRRRGGLALPSRAVLPALPLSPAAGAD